ncbi:phytanoyl-CoA dioxygenase family protein [Rapidithrix thailandica]|uniref:Phytanoyl-CoA dioxygenase family protein n=1 Tax=Rapidithrix thailandica TaxID=413964 RepID=A0AAW9SAB5_9BACT
MVRQFDSSGYKTISQFYAFSEIQNLLSCIQEQTEKHPDFQGTQTLFAIRRLFKEFPELKEEFLHSKLRTFVQSIHPNYRLVKAIYFDKPPQANWIVNWHQDLTVAVTHKKEQEGFTHWLKKKDQYSVHPPLTFLQDQLTLRIHLDDCTSQNGALRVIPQTHHDLIRPEDFTDTLLSQEQICEVEAGGILMMKPLILHSSRRTENQQSRRVIHLEFSTLDLPEGMQWAEEEDWI